MNLRQVEAQVIADEAHARRYEAEGYPMIAEIFRLSDDEWCYALAYLSAVVPDVFAVAVHKAKGYPCIG